jgi:hypothetical protein
VNDAVAREQLDLELATLPPAFIERWRELETHFALKPATLSAHEAVLTGRQWWIVVKVDGHPWACLSREDPREAADAVWRYSGRPS